MPAYGEGRSLRPSHEHRPRLGPPERDWQPGRPDRRMVRVLEERHARRQREPELTPQEKKQRFDKDPLMKLGQFALGVDWDFDLPGEEDPFGGLKGVPYESGQEEYIAAKRANPYGLLSFGPAFDAWEDEIQNTKYRKRKEAAERAENEDCCSHCAFEDDGIPFWVKDKRANPHRYVHTPTAKEEIATTTADLRLQLDAKRAAVEKQRGADFDVLAAKERRKYASYSAASTRLVETKERDETAVQSPASPVRQRALTSKQLKKLIADQIDDLRTRIGLLKSKFTKK
ncbi:hypothetical protein M3Y99_00827600 [Aphelenchoides fujianensis]|nr:hypothetical protein M3Y99_00827600 [Aphelenchoides fujianensis]